MEPTALPTERDAAILQVAITLGLALLFGLLHRRYRRPYFFWWSSAWLLYTVRIGLIITFLSTNNWVWLYLHQVATGWTALALLAAAFSFERRRGPRRIWLLTALFPVVWAYLTIYVLDSFLLAASLTVLLLSGATGWTGVVFLRYRRRTGSPAAGFLAGTLLLWALHHLDYPILRARGLLAPWSYYLDILFILALGIGVLLLVLEELRGGLRTLSRLSGDLQRSPDADARPERLLEHALGLAGVTGSALWSIGPEPAGAFTHAIGTASGWIGRPPDGPLVETLHTATQTARPILLTDWDLSTLGVTERQPFVAVLPVIPHGVSRGAAVILGRTREPFTALDEDFLVALGQQIGAALQNADLERRLRDRTAQMERLSLQLIHQHEDQRRRLSRELHDETAQVFSAMKLHLGLLRETAGDRGAARIESLTDLVDAGIQSIRSVAEDLRPPVLDDLGLGAALQALASDFGERTEIPIDYTANELPSLSDEAELALFRTLQEALSNVARHAGASRVEVVVAAADSEIHLTVTDDGRGIDLSQGALRTGRMGLVGMEERLAAVGGRLSFESSPGRGLRLDVVLPVVPSEAMR